VAPRIQLSVAIANGFDVIFLHLEPVGPWPFARLPTDFDSISADMPM
jgi:hypothetical protein